METVYCFEIEAWVTDGIVDSGEHAGTIHRPCVGCSYPDMCIPNAKGELT